MAGNPLESLSDNDLQALKAGNLDMVSDTGLMTLKQFSQVKAEGQQVKPPTPFRPSGEKALSPGEEVLANPYGRAALGLVKPVIGTGQLALNISGQGEDINRALADIAASQARARQFVGSEGLDLAEMTGQGVGMMLPAGLMKNAATTTGRIGQGALFGGGAGAAETVTDPNNYWGQKAAQIGLGTTVGGVAPGLWEAGKAVGRGVRNVAQPYMGQWGADQAAGRLANTAAGDKADDIITSLRQNQVIVPGSNPTAGQAAVGANRAEFNALQKIAADEAPSGYVGPKGIYGQQDAARLAAVRTVGQTPQALDSAVAARAAQGKVDYEAAFQQAVKADPTLMRMAQNPFFKGALADASRLAEANGIDPKNQLTQYLHYVKLSLDKQLGRTGDTALASTEKKAVTNLQEQLVNWMGAKNPAYERARTNFEAASKPINQMELGQQLESKLTQPLADEGKLRAGVFATELRNLSPELQKTMRPDQLETLRKVQADLARDKTATDLARGGNKAAMEIIDKNVGKAPPSGMFSPVISVARGAYNRAAGGASEKTLQDLATIMQNPKKMADVMEKAKPFERAQLVDLIMRMQAATAQDLANEGGALAQRKPPRGALSR
jgi:hypothetical protein